MTHVPLLPGEIREEEVGLIREGESYIDIFRGDGEIFLLPLTPKVGPKMPKELILENPEGIGVLARILDLHSRPGGGYVLRLEGIQRARVASEPENGSVDIVLLTLEGEEDEAMALAVRTLINEKMENPEKAALPPEISLPGEEETALRYLDALASLLAMSPAARMKYLCCRTVMESALFLAEKLEIGNAAESILRSLQEKLQEAIDKNQKEYVLREQLRIIREELGDAQDTGNLADQYASEAAALDAPEEVKQKLEKEIQRFRASNPQNPESSVLQNYIETMLKIPWSEKSTEKLQLSRAERILDRDHYGLNKVKARILEYLAVRKHTEKGTPVILCLVGPPGTGKTSIAKSLAEAMNRRYVRISLGGLHDEAEIRGHRRTYVAAMPGRIANAMIEAKVKNPLMLLDEIDKLGSDYKGDPSNAFLEVLDPAQNHSFHDNYLEVPLDLSEVLFLATANDMATIPRPLYDRMEILRIPGYTENEKVHIAKDHLLPRQREMHGLKASNMKLTDEALSVLIQEYTREAGVRELDRRIAELCRKVVKQSFDNNKKRVTIDEKVLRELLGLGVRRPGEIENEDLVGCVKGLAWTSVGGETLEIEALFMPGSGKIQITGNLGDVMKESASAAVSYIRSRAKDFDIPDKFFKDHDLHVHVPEGAIPKDGPSAGITITTAILSAATQIPVRGDTAMTGEITLRGRVLPIGGLQEKLLAAKQAKRSNVIIPYDNREDLTEISKEITDGLTILPVKTVDEVFDAALRREAAPEKKPKSRRTTTKSKEGSRE